MAGKKARVNLMRWNPVSGVVDFGRPPDRPLASFREVLARAGLPVAVRDTQGRDISGACGQLWLRDLQGAALPPRRRLPVLRD